MQQESTPNATDAVTELWQPNSLRRGGSCSRLSLSEKRSNGHQGAQRGPAPAAEEDAPAQEGNPLMDEQAATPQEMCQHYTCVSSFQQPAYGIPGPGFPPEVLPQNML